MDNQHPYQCQKCGRHQSIETIEIDKEKPRKKWRVFRCAVCEHPYDIEPYIELIERPNKSKYEYPNPFDEGSH